MKKNLKLPTIIGLLVLILGLGFGIYAIKNTQIFKISADVEAIPKNVRVSNITDSSFTVSWTTDVDSIGFIKYGKSVNSLSETSSEENNLKNKVHLIKIDRQNPETIVYFKINSNGKEYDNSNIAWQTKTNSNGYQNSSSILASGTVLNVDGQTPSKALVYLTINGTLISGMTSDEGSFVIPVSQYLSSTNVNDTVEISVIDGLQQSSQAVIYEGLLKTIPTIILGKTYDFRTLSTSGLDKEPQGSLTIPEMAERSSRFEVTKTEVNQVDNNVSLDSIKNGEIINTDDPNFFGSAPKSTSLEIKVESELQTGTVTTNSKGKWSWSPSKNLESGEHKITISWKDTAGVVRTLTRTFIVSASEGPAFVSTPSATPLVTTTPTATAISISTPTNIPTITPTGTIQPVPETGTLTPTIGLFIMGIGTLLSSIFIYKHSFETSS